MSALNNNDDVFDSECGKRAHRKATKFWEGINVYFGPRWTTV